MHIMQKFPSSIQMLHPDVAFKVYLFIYFLLSQMILKKQQNKKKIQE